MQLCGKVKDLLSRLGETPENFTGRILFMSMFNDISCGTKDNEQECLANARLVTLYERKFGKGQWSFIGPGSEKKWYSMKEDSPQGIWDNLAEKMLMEFAESGYVLPSTAPESPVKTRHESQFPLSPQTEQHHTTGRPVVYAYSSSHSEWNVDKNWSSQEWKSDELMEVRTGRPVLFAQHTDRFIVENDNMDSDTEAESEMSLESRSSLYRVNDQVRKRQYQSSKDAMQDSDKHSVIWRMFMSSTLQASVFMVENYSDNWHSIKNTEDLTMKQMFDISEKLISEQSDEIYGVNTINWEDSSWNHLFLVGGEKVISLSHIKVYVFSDSVLCLGKMNENPQSNYAWEDRLMWFKSSSQYRALDRIDGEPMEFEWNIFPGFTTLQLCSKVQELLSRLSVEPEKFTGRIIFVSMFNDISFGSRDNEKECESNANLVSQNAKRFGIGQWSFLGPGSEKKWYSICADSPQGEWDTMAEKMMLEFAESGHPIFSATSPLSRGTLKSKGHGKLSIRDCANLETIKTVFRTIISVNQLSFYGADAQICEEHETFHDRTGQPVVRGQSSSSFVPSVIKTEVPLDCDDLARKDLLLQQYGERIEKLSQQDKLSKFCMDAGFLSVVEIGQYFMTKDTADLTQFHAVACREYTLPREDGSSQPR